MQFTGCDHEVQLHSYWPENAQLTGWDNGNEMCNAACVDSKTSIEWPYCSFPIYCAKMSEKNNFWLYFLHDTQ